MVARRSVHSLGTRLGPVWATIALVAVANVCRLAAAQDGGDVRLFGGANVSIGRLEIYSNVQQGWVTVCAHGMNDNAARVVCRQLGYISGTRASWSTVTREDEYGSPPVVALGDPLIFIPPNCSGAEADILQCNDSVSSTSTPCTGHSEDVVVSCQGRANGDVRLFGGPSPSQGRLEMYNAASGTWGTVCDDNMDHNAAAVVCRQLGHPVGAKATWETVKDINQYGPPPSDPNGGDTIFFDGFSCTGAEMRFRDCGTFPRNENCRHNEDVAVTCSLAAGPISPPKPPKPPMPPAPSPREGSDPNQAGCRSDYGFSGTDLTPIDNCRACQNACYFDLFCLGWTWNNTHGEPYDNKFGEDSPCTGEGCRWYRDEVTPEVLPMTGSPTTCSSCRQGCKRDPLCKYFSWQGGARLSDLSDSDAACADGALRLGNGDGDATVGRLQIYSVASGRWVSICSLAFDKVAAVVACRQLGIRDANESSVDFASASAFRDPSIWGPAPRDTPDTGTWYPAFLCTGAETRLTQCRPVTSILIDGFQAHHSDCKNTAHNYDVILSCGARPAQPPSPVPALPPPGLALSPVGGDPESPPFLPSPLGPSMPSPAAPATPGYGCYGTGGNGSYAGSVYGAGYGGYGYGGYGGYGYGGYANYPGVGYGGCFYGGSGEEVGGAFAPPFRRKVPQSAMQEHHAARIMHRRRQTFSVLRNSSFASALKRLRGY